MPSRLKRARRRVTGLAALFAFSAASRLPRGWARALGRRLGRVAYFVLRSDRRRAARQLSRALGAERDPAEREQIVRSMFQHFGATFLENFVIQRWGAEAIRRRIPVADWDRAAERVNRGRQEGKGVVLVTGHLGNWELVSTYGTTSFPETACVARRYQVPEYQRIVARIRAGFGAPVIYQDESLRPLVRVLRSNGVVGLLVDQDAKNVQGVFVDFFRRPAYTPEAPAKLSLRLGSPLVPVYIVWDGAGYRALSSDPIYPESATGAEDPVACLTRSWCEVLERFIRECPEQWVWTHRRWHTTPQILARRREREALESAARSGRSKRA